jgi:hypothetical protein
MIMIRKNKMYGVLSLKETLGVEVLGLKTELSLSWYDGQIGAIPVFETKEQALKYVDGNEDRIFKLELKENK